MELMLPYSYVILTQFSINKIKVCLLASAFAKCKYLALSEVSFRVSESEGI